jgi:predicted nucleic acid-binding protein
VRVFIDTNVLVYAVDRADPTKRDRARAVLSLGADGGLVVSAQVLAAAERAQRDRLSFWDAMIVQAAIDAGCDVLLTEDLQHGRDHDGLVVRDPFRDTRA